MMLGSRKRSVRIYINISGPDNALPPLAADLVREAIATIGEGQTSPLYAILPAVEGARGPLYVAIEWMFACDRTVGARIRVGPDKVCRVVGGGVNYDPASDDPSSGEGWSLVVGVGACGAYEIDYGPRSILRWLANVVEPSRAPEPKTGPAGSPDPGPDHPGAGDRPGGAGDWYTASLRRAMGDE